MQPANDILA